MNAAFIKAAMFTWLRFTRNNMMVATEVAYDSFVADLMAFNGKEFTEVEVKSSFSDFKADFQKKCKWTYRTKHDFSNENPRWFMPNRFYFALEGNLAKRAKEYVQENNYPKVGIISVNGINDVEIIRNASSLREANPNLFKPIQKAILQRMSSQLASEILTKAKIADVASMETYRRTDIQPEQLCIPEEVFFL